MKRVVIEIDYRKAIKFLRAFFVFALISVWLFSGWPRIWQKPSIPPKIPQAKAAAPAEATTPSISGTPPAPQITSTTHPDPNRWFSQTKGEFSWTLPSGVTATRLLLNHLPQSTPLVVYSPPISSKSFAEIEPGVWYLHVQFKNKLGWGAIAHYKIQVDIDPPSPFTIEFEGEKDSDNPTPTISYKTSDQLSGMDCYKIRINQEEPIETKDSTYTLAPQTPGDKTVLVQAFDQAGNFATAMEDPVSLPILSKSKPLKFLKPKGWRCPIPK